MAVLENRGVGCVYFVSRGSRWLLAAFLMLGLAFFHIYKFYDIMIGLVDDYCTERLQSYITCHKRRKN
jgi:hypothetical protein